MNLPLLLGQKCSFGQKHCLRSTLSLGSKKNQRSVSLVTLEIFTRPSVTERDASKTKCQLLSSYPHLSSMSCHLTKLAISGYTQSKYANNSTISMDPRQFEGHFQFHLSPEDTLNNYNRLNFELFSFWIFRKLQIKSFKRRQ